MARFSKSARIAKFFVFATLEPSMTAYHLRLQPNGRTLRHRRDHFGVSTMFIAFLRPEKSARVFSRPGPSSGPCIRSPRKSMRYVAASLGGKRGIIRLSPQAVPEIVLGGANIVGLALLPNHRAIFATTSALFLSRLGYRRPPTQRLRCHARGNHSRWVRAAHAISSGYEFASSSPRS